MFEVLWLEGVSEGWSDFLPSDWFRDGFSRPQAGHFVVRRDKSLSRIARCSVDVNDGIAELNYGDSHRTYNQSQGMLIGKAKIRFEKKYSNIQLYEWCDDGGVYKKANVELSSCDEWLAVAEGDRELAAHMRSERDPSIVKSKKEIALANDGDLRCEACNFSFSERYRNIDMGSSFCEVHHRTEVAHGPSLTELSSLAILCANCHRMIHRTKPMKSVEEFTRDCVMNSQNPAL